MRVEQLWDELPERDLHGVVELFPKAVNLYIELVDLLHKVRKKEVQLLSHAVFSGSLPLVPNWTRHIAR